MNARVKAWSKRHQRSQTDPTIVAAASGSSPSTRWDPLVFASAQSGDGAGIGSLVPVEGWHFAPDSTLLYYSDGRSFTEILDPASMEYYRLHHRLTSRGTMLLSVQRHSTIHNDCSPGFLLTFSARVLWHCMTIAMRSLYICYCIPNSLLLFDPPFSKSKVTLHPYNDSLLRNHTGR